MKKKVLSILLALCCLLQSAPGAIAKALDSAPSDRYVVQIVADGLTDALFDQAKAAGVSTPHIDALISSGARLRNVKTVIPSYGGAQAAALTGADTKANNFLYRYYDKTANAVKTDSASCCQMKAQTIFEKMQASTTGVGALATGWSLDNSVSINGRGISTTGTDYKLIEHGTGDTLVSVSTITADIITAINSDTTPHFMTGYSNDIKMVGWGGTDSTTLTKVGTAITLIDTKIGEIQNALQAKGIADKTTIVLNSLADFTPMSSKIATATIAGDLTNKAGVAVTDSSSTVPGTAKAVLVKQYGYNNAQLYFTAQATVDDKTKVLNYLQDKTNSDGKAISKIYAGSDLGLPDQFCDYLLVPVANTFFCSAGTGCYRYDDTPGNTVFCVLSGDGVPAGSSVLGNASVLDLVPTICNMLGVAAPDNCEGTAWNLQVLPNPPAITISSPTDNSNVYKNVITVSGTVDGQCDTLTVNNQPVTPSGKSFSANVTMSEGANTITVTATNSGGTTTKTIHVNYVIRQPMPDGNRVVYINWDGFANYYIGLAEAQGKIPTLDKIMKSDGVYFPNAFTNCPSITDAMQPAIVAGTTPKYTDNHYRYFDKRTNAVIQENPGRKNMAETIAEAAVRQNLDVISINQFALQDRGTTAGDPFKAYVEAPAGSDGYSDAMARFDCAISMVKNLQAGSTKLEEIPRFIALYMDDLDGIGHNEEETYGVPLAATEAQREQSVVDRLALMDQKLGEFIQACKDTGIYDSMDFVLTTDHGMAPFGIQNSPSDDSATTSLPDLMSTISSLGAGYKCELLYGGQKPAADTDIALVTVGLQAQLSYVNVTDPNEIAKRNAAIIKAVKDKKYVDVIRQPADIAASGDKTGFADLIISPKPPYSFHNPGMLDTIARGQHDSLVDQAQRIGAFLWGKDVKKGYSDTETIHNTDFAATMAYLMGVNAPLDSTGKIIYSALDGKTQPQEYKTTMEAEDAQLNGNAEKQLDSMASGGGYVGNTDSDQASIEFENVPETTRMEVHYAAANDGLMTLKVNGAPVRDIFFPNNGVSSGSYDTKIINITLKKGDSVQFVTNKTTSGVGVSFDSIDFINSAQQTPDPSGNTGKPYDINMTPNGDTKTDMGFDWFTDPSVTGTKVQVVKATGDTADFSSGVVEFNGVSQTAALKKAGVNTNYVSHKAKATGLTAGTKYFYRVGDSTTWSDTGSFTTASDNGFSFVFLTDPQGTTSDDYDLWANALQKASDAFPNASFMAMGGDMINTTPMTANDEQQWAYFFGKKQNIFMGLPIAPAVGNHEGRNNPNYQDHFNLPVNSAIQTFPSNSVYSFDYGNAHFAVLNTEMLLTTQDFASQISWLKKDMTQTDKKWKILMFHKPVYSVGEHCTDDDIVNILRPSLQPVIDQLGIDLILQGHDHVYSRTFQLLNGQATGDTVTNGTVTNPQGTVYLVNGSSGYKFYDINKNANTSIMAKYAQPNAQMFSGITVTDDSLKISSYTVNSADVFDTYTISRTDKAPDPVSNFIADYSQSGKVTLSWAAPSGAKSFTLYEKNNAMAPNWTMYTAAASGQTQYSATVNIDNSKQYDFAIKAMCDRAMSAETTAVDTGVAKLIDDINALPNVITLADKDQINSLNDAYNQLTDTQKAQVTNKNILDAAVTQLKALENDLSKANEVISAIAALPAKISPNDRPTIEAARAAYSSLTPGQKTLVNNLGVLSAAEVALAQLTSDQAAADLVVSKISAISSPVTLADQGAIEDAKISYEKLTDSEKALVTNKSVLDAAISVLTTLEKRHDEKTNITVAGNGLPDDVALSASQITDHKSDVFVSMAKKANGENLLELFDISLLRNNSRYEPNGTITITLPLPAELVGATGLKIAHFKDDGTVSYIIPTISDNQMTFITDSLSYFGIVTDNSASSSTQAENTASNPKTGCDDENGALYFIIADISILLPVTRIKRKRFSIKKR